MPCARQRASPPRSGGLRCGLFVRKMARRNQIFVRCGLSIFVSHRRPHHPALCTSAGAAGDALPAAGAKIWGILERKSQLSININDELIMSGKVRFMSRSTSRGRHFYTNPPYRTRTGVEPKFWLQTGDFFAAWWGARGSAPPRRAAAAYGVAYLYTK